MIEAKCPDDCGCEEHGRYPTKETPCSKREDKIHCECWYDGERCCACEEE